MQIVIQDTRACIVQHTTSHCRIYRIIFGSTIRIGSILDKTILYSSFDSISNSSSALLHMHRVFIRILAIIILIFSILIVFLVLFFVRIMFADHIKMRIFRFESTLRHI